MKIIYRLGLSVLGIILCLFFGLSHYNQAASESMVSKASSATVKFDRVINMPDQEIPNDSHPSGTVPPGGGSYGNSGSGYYGNSRPSMGSSARGKLLPQMGEYLLNGFITILGILLVVLSARYMYYKKALHSD